MKKLFYLILIGISCSSLSMEKEKKKDAMNAKICNQCNFPHSTMFHIRACHKLKCKYTTCGYCRKPLRQYRDPTLCNYCKKVHKWSRYKKYFDPDNSNND